MRNSTRPFPTYSNATMPALTPRSQGLGTTSSTYPGVYPGPQDMGCVAGKLAKEACDRALAFGKSTLSQWTQRPDAGPRKRQALLHEKKLETLNVKLQRLLQQSNPQTLQFSKLWNDYKKDAHLPYERERRSEAEQLFCKCLARSQLSEASQEAIKKECFGSASTLPCSQNEKTQAAATSSPSIVLEKLGQLFSQVVENAFVTHLHKTGSHLVNWVYRFNFPPLSSASPLSLVSIGDGEQCETPCCISPTPNNAVSMSVNGKVYCIDINTIFMVINGEGCCFDPKRYGSRPTRHGYGRLLLLPDLFRPANQVELDEPTKKFIIDQLTPVQNAAQENLRTAEQFAAPVFKIKQKWKNRLLDREPELVALTRRSQWIPYEEISPLPLPEMLEHLSPHRHQALEQFFADPQEREAFQNCVMRLVRFEYHRLIVNAQLRFLNLKQRYTDALSSLEEEQKQYEDSPFPRTWNLTSKLVGEVESTIGKPFIDEDDVHALNSWIEQLYTLADDKQDLDAPRSGFFADLAKTAARAQKTDAHLSEQARSYDCEDKGFLQREIDKKLDHCVQQIKTMRR